MIGPMAVTVDALGPKARRYHREVTEFVREEILPAEQQRRDHSLAEDWSPSAKVEQLKARARAAGGNRRPSSRSPIRGRARAPRAALPTRPRRPAGKGGFEMP